MDGLSDERVSLTLASKMPYGKYQGRRIIDIPEPYLVWMARSGFPAGNLGQSLALAYEIKLNGLESMIIPIINRMSESEYIRGKGTRAHAAGRWHLPGQKIDSTRRDLWRYRRAQFPDRRCLMAEIPAGRDGIIGRFILLQQELFDLGGSWHFPVKRRMPRLWQVNERLDAQARTAVSMPDSAQLPALRNFILPSGSCGGGPGAMWCVPLTRRRERLLLGLEPGRAGGPCGAALSEPAE